MPEENSIDISIVIPCFNEAAGIAHLAANIKALEQRLTEPHELIFVDDGSSDSTYERLASFYRRRDRDVKIISHSENRGLGAAIRTGVLDAQGYYLAVIDSDCTYKLTHLLRMLELIKREKADIIAASPYHPEGATDNVPGYRLFLSKNLSNLYGMILGSKFYTYTSIFRIYRTEVIKNLNFNSNGFLAIAEILIKAYKKGFRIIEYPATLTARKYGSSNAKIIKVIMEHLSFMAKLVLNRED